MPRRNHKETRAQGAKRKPREQVMGLATNTNKTPALRPSIKVGQTVEQWRKEQGF